MVCPHIHAWRILSIHVLRHTVVSHPSPSRHGEEHPSMNPPTWGRFAKLVVDNRYGASCRSGPARYIRLYEFEALQVVLT